FTDLDLGKVLALQSTRVVPIDGKTTGRADLVFDGADLRTATGTLKADISANAGSADKGQIPLTGVVDLVATNGLFTIQNGNLRDPVIEGKASVYSVVLHGRDIGSVETAINVSPVGVNLRDGKLTQRDGGSATFAVNVPYGAPNSTTVDATLSGINAGNLIA